MSRPRVFYVLGSLEANDWGEEIVTILGRLSRASVEPRVIALGGREDLRERIAAMKVRVYPLGLSGPIGSLLAVPRVRRLLKSMDADVVHGFGSWGVVRSVSRPPASGRDLKGWILGMLERRAARRSGVHYVVPSEAGRAMVEAHYAGGDVTVLPSSVDVGEIRRRVDELGREGGRRHLGIADEDTVFACVSAFLLGDGRYEATSRWKAEQLQLDDSVVFLGRGPDAEAIWAAADVVVDAAPWPGWSRGALVAHAAGLPVVKRVEGVVEDGLEEGSEPPRISGRSDWFAADLVRLAEDPGLRDRLSGQADRWVRDSDVAAVAHQLRDLYLGLA